MAKTKGGLGVAMCRDRKAQRRISAGRPERAAARRAVAQPAAAVGPQRRGARDVRLDRRPALPGHAGHHPPGPRPRPWPGRGSTCRGPRSCRASAGMQVPMPVPDTPPALAAALAARRRRRALLAADGRDDRPAIRIAPRPDGPTSRPTQRGDADRPDHRRPVPRPAAADRHGSTMPWSSPRARSGAGRPMRRSTFPSRRRRPPRRVLRPDRCPARSR